MTGIDFGHSRDRKRRRPNNLRWRVGYAEADITPRPGEAFMSGFGIKRYARGTLAPLRAQAVSFEDASGKRAILVAADLLGYSRVQVNAIRVKIEQSFSVPPESVTLSASHTHCGPTVNYGLNFAVGGLNVWYLARLEDTLMKIIGKALRSLSPATIGYTDFEAQIGLNRRLIREGKAVAMGPNPDGVYDRHTPVIRISRRRSPKEVILVSHACHPTSSGPYDKWSPDWPGALRTKVETSLKDCRVIFAKGCGADANVVYRNRLTGKVAFSRDPVRSRRAGNQLAEKLLAHYSGTEPNPLHSSLSSTIACGQLSLQKRKSLSEIEAMATKGDIRKHATWWARQSLAYPDARTAVDYDVQAWRLGELTLFLLEGEVCADLGIAVRQLIDGPTVSVAYTNACPGYISTARLIREGGYEGDTSHMAYFLPAPFAEKSEDEFLTLCRKAARGLQ